MVEEIFHKLRLAETRTYGHVRSEAQMNGTILLFMGIVILKDFFRTTIQINLKVYLEKKLNQISFTTSHV